MSTKTTFKRVALVAVASLGFGMLSVVPSSAANLTTFLTTSLSLKTVTAAPTVGTAVAVNLGGVFPAQTLGATTDSTAFTGYISSYPSGGFAGTTAAALTGAGAAVSVISVLPVAGAAVAGVITAALVAAV